MKKLIFALLLALVTSTAATAQSFIDFGTPERATYRGLSSYNLGLSIPGGLTFSSTPSLGVSATQAMGVALGYTTVFADLQALTIASESEVVYRNITWRSNSDKAALRKTNMQGLTGLGIYFNSGKHLAFYGKGLIGIQTEIGSGEGLIFSDVFRLEARLGVLYTLGSHFALFAESGYGQDILRLGISIR